ncbi:hypothetical protein KBC89_04600 [Candidatus Woesebacteria bacterium]|nr:hypothetical protein [Candidatus Woesebacteria bacterium]
MKNWWPALGAIIFLLAAGVVVYTYKNKTPEKTAMPTPTPVAAIQLPASEQPKVSLAFSSDSHFATVTLTNLKADKLEYNLIYDATVKNNKISTGVNSTANVTGKSTFTEKQLLGSESSGKFTYHANIANAVMELTLRDAQGRSIFTSTYPFEVKPGSTVSLTASE